MKSKLFGLALETFLSVLCLCAIATGKGDDFTLIILGTCIAGIYNDVVDIIYLKCGGINTSKQELENAHYIMRKEWQANPESYRSEEEMLKQDARELAKDDTHELLAAIIKARA